MIDPLLARLEARWPERAHLRATGGSNSRTATCTATFHSCTRPSRRRSVSYAPRRGDEGAHGRKAPDPYEIRYLLFQLCNTALLLLDYDAMKADLGTPSNPD